jgi:SH3-like domain-containing protein
MLFRNFRWFSLLIIAILILLSSFALNTIDTVSAQQPTGSIPTVTGTPKGPTATIRIGLSDDRVNVRSGPSVLYPQIGVILLGAEVPVIGKSEGGDWLVIEYPGVKGGIGWVWALYMNVSPGELAVIESPPLPEPIVTVTIDPTMAAQFITTPIATKLPTFTAPPPLTIPTYESSTGQTLGGIPIGLIIILLAGAGILIALFSYFQVR